jgi:hypothetical protein
MGGLAYCLGAPAAFPVVDGGCPTQETGLNGVPELVNGAPPGPAGQARLQGPPGIPSRAQLSLPPKEPVTLVP